MNEIRLEVFPIPVKGVGVIDGWMTVVETLISPLMEIYFLISEGETQRAWEDFSQLVQDHAAIGSDFQQGVWDSLQDLGVALEVALHPDSNREAFARLLGKNPALDPDPESYLGEKPLEAYARLYALAIIDRISPMIQQGGEVLPRQYSKGEALDCAGRYAEQLLKKTEHPVSVGIYCWDGRSQGRWEFTIDSGQSIS